MGQKTPSPLDRFNRIQSSGQEFSFGKQEQDKLAEILKGFGSTIQNDRSNTKSTIKQIIKTIDLTVKGLETLYKKEKANNQEDAASKIQSTYIDYVRLKGHIEHIRGNPPALPKIISDFIEERKKIAEASSQEQLSQATTAVEQPQTVEQTEQKRQRRLT